MHGAALPPLPLPLPLPSLLSRPGPGPPPPRPHPLPRPLLRPLPPQKGHPALTATPPQPTMKRRRRRRGEDRRRCCCCCCCDLQTPIDLSKANRSGLPRVLLSNPYPTLPSGMPENSAHLTSCGWFSSSLHGMPVTIVRIGHPTLPYPYPVPLELELERPAAPLREEGAQQSEVRAALPQRLGQVTAGQHVSMYVCEYVSV